MNIFDKSLLAIDNYLLRVDNGEIEKVLEEVSGFEYEGPILEDFFTSYFQNRPFRFKFQDGVIQYEIKHSEISFQLKTPTPKFPLESFFCNIASWKMQNQLILN